MKAVLISIHPRHCANIAKGKKTIEVRKSAPKIQTPFKCYIYMTKNGNPALEVQEKDGNSYFVRNNYHMAGKVVGEFVCDKIGQIRFDDDGDLLYEPCLVGSSPCLSLGELQSYIGVNNVGYGWHISDLKIYDKSKELSEFSKPECEKDGDTCFHCRYSINVGYYECPEWGCDRSIIRPPQSWCYVEGL